jgi:hypothetical protein
MLSVEALEERQAASSLSALDELWAAVQALPLDRGPGCDPVPHRAWAPSLAELPPDYYERHDAFRNGYKNDWYYSWKERGTQLRIAPPLDEERPYVSNVDYWGETICGEPLVYFTRAGNYMVKLDDRPAWWVAVNSAPGGLREAAPEEVTRFKRFGPPHRQGGIQGNLSYRNVLESSPDDNGFLTGTEGWFRAARPQNVTQAIAALRALPEGRTVWVTMVGHGGTDGISVGQGNRPSCAPDKGLTQGSCLPELERFVSELNPVVHMISFYSCNGALGLELTPNHWLHRISRGLSNGSFNAQASAFTVCVYPVDEGGSGHFEIPVHGQEKWSINGRVKS